MALWQFDCMIIPKRNEFIDTKSEEILSWKNVEVPVNIREIVQGILPLSEGWSDKVLIYGEIDGTCIELFLEEEKVEEIILRMDLRDLTKNARKNYGCC